MKMVFIKLHSLHIIQNFNMLKTVINVSIGEAKILHLHPQNNLRWGNELRNACT